MSTFLKTMKWGAGIGFILLLIASVLAYLNTKSIFLPSWHKEALKGAYSDQGYSYLVQTNHPEWSSHEKPSLARVTENGKPLQGPANALHQDIRDMGKGRYSFWHDYVYFSASDNSNPLNNNRVYDMEYPKYISPGKAMLLYVSAVLFGIGLLALSLYSRKK